ncbi:MAG: FAD-dependent oxidoreductase [Myxococcota bacterium]
MRIAVLGGGLAGLAASHYLLRAGHQPVVLESRSTVGGYLAPFEYEGLSLDPFPQIIGHRDSALCGLLAEIGILGRAVWRSVDGALLCRGMLLPSGSAAAALRFRELGLLDRLRAALAILYATRIRRFGLDLDTRSSREWLTRLSGSRVWERFWRPYLRSRLGEGVESVPAYWVWERLNSESQDRAERMGYFPGGSEEWISELRASLDERGAVVRCGSPVTSIESSGGGLAIEVAGGHERFDAGVSTLRLETLSKLASPNLLEALPAPGLTYQAMQSVLVVSRAPLSRFFWTQACDLELPFQAVFETTRVIPVESTGGRHLIYLVSRCSPTSAEFRADEREVAERSLRALQGAYREFSRADVEFVRVFRNASAQPLWPLGYLGRKPSPRLRSGPLYLCCEEQAYPRESSLSSQVTIAREAVRLLQSDLG